MNTVDTDGVCCVETVNGVWVRGLGVPGIPRYPWQLGLSSTADRISLPYSLLLCKDVHGDIDHSFLPNEELTDIFNPSDVKELNTVGLRVGEVINLTDSPPYDPPGDGKFAPSYDS